MERVSRCELSEGGSPKRDPGGERGRPMLETQGLGGVFEIRRKD
jgi:hypothetical protein